MSTASPLRCFVCGSTATTPNIEVHTDTGYDLARCGSCETLFTDARNAPPASELYPAFSQSADGVAAASNKAASGFLRKRVSVAQSVSRSGRSLDFGAGNGAFARAMQAAGFDSVGLEPFSLGAPTTSPGLKLLRAPLADVADDLGQFDVITMWHVFEHLDNPVEVLRQLAGHLTPTGAFVISVPNERSWQRRVFRRSWFHLDPPRHLIHFDASTLADVLGRADLQVKANHPFLPEYGTSGWVQSVLNRVLPHRNFLYEVVKDRGALAKMPRASFIGHLAVSLLIGAPIFVLAWPVEWLAARSNAAAALTVVARPRPDEAHTG
jgi:SAM-dependent methyltransferase